MAIRSTDITLNTFKQKISNIARPNRFTVEFSNVPNALKSLYTELSVDDLKFLCTAASIPTFDLEGPSFKFRGTQLALPGDYKREPISIGFINDDQWFARKIMEDWMRLMVNYDKSNNRRKILDNRFGINMTVTQWGNSVDTTEKIAIYEYQDIIPLKVEGIELNQTTTNSIEEFKVDFHYTSWERVTTNRQTTDTDTKKLADTNDTNTMASPFGVKVPLYEIIGVPLNSEGGINWESSQFKNIDAAKRKDIINLFNAGRN